MKTQSSSTSHTFFSTAPSAMSADSMHSTKSSLNIWKLTVHVLLKPGLENFEHYFASV